MDFRRVIEFKQILGEIEKKSKELFSQRAADPDVSTEESHPLGPMNSNALLQSKGKEGTLPISRMEIVRK